MGSIRSIDNLSNNIKYFAYRLQHRITHTIYNNMCNMIPLLYCNEYYLCGFVCGSMWWWFLTWRQNDFNFIFRCCYSLHITNHVQHKPKIKRTTWTNTTISMAIQNSLIMIFDNICIIFNGSIQMMQFVYMSI